MKTQTLLYVLLIFSSAILYGQKPAELGIHFSRNNTRNVMLDFRLPVGEKYHLKFGATYGFYGTWPGGSTIISTTDSSYTNKTNYSSNYHGALNFGATRQFGTSVFSLNSDLNIGFRSSKKNYREYTYVLNESGDYESATVYGSIFEPPINGSEATNYHLYFGLLFGGAMNLPVGNRFVIELSLGGYGTYYTPVGQKIEYDNLNVIEPNDVSFFNLDVVASIGLRYKFKSK